MRRRVQCQTVEARAQSGGLLSKLDLFANPFAEPFDFVQLRLAEFLGACLAKLEFPIGVACLDVVFDNALEQIELFRCQCQICCFCEFEQLVSPRRWRLRLLHKQRLE